MLARSVDPALKGIRSQDAEVRDVAGFYKDYSPSNSGLTAALPDMGLSKMASPTAEVDSDLAVGRGLWTLGVGRWTGLRRVHCLTRSELSFLGLLACFPGGDDGVIDVRSRPKRGCNIFRLGGEQMRRV
jgi:hypothetical protein